MRNQTSFRLTTTLLPSDTTANTTTVINKVDGNGDKYLPHFPNNVETVVLTNDDRTIMETTRATCDNGVLTFVKRGLSDDLDPLTGEEYEISNRKLTWNPGSLAFITASAGDILDKDDDIVWTGHQTYTGAATYKGALTTEKGVEYPHFDSLEDLQAYTDPFGGMFAVVDSDGELYRYNDVSDTWSVVTTSTPAQPAQASTVVIGTVRGATDAEFAAGTATGSNSELLVATPAQIKSAMPTMSLSVTNINQASDYVSTAGSSKSVSYTVNKSGFITIGRFDNANSTSLASHSTCYSVSVSSTGTIAKASFSGPSVGDGLGNGLEWEHLDLYAVGPGTITVTITCNYTCTIQERVKIKDFFYFA